MCPLWKEKMREWLKKFQKNKTCIFLGSSFVVYDCGMLVDKNREII